MRPFFKFTSILFFCGLTCFFLLYSSTGEQVRAQGAQDKIEEQKDELQKIRKELEEKRDKVKKLSKRESSVFIEIKNLEEELELMDKLLFRLNQESRKTGKDILAKQELLKNSQSELKDKRETSLQAEGYLQIYALPGIRDTHGCLLSS